MTLRCFDQNGNITALGSGFIIAPTGVGVTNWHVVENATQAVSVTTGDGREYGLTEITAFDESADLVVFRFGQVQLDGAVNYPQTLPVLPLGSSLSLKAGERLSTIGSPEGLTNSVSDGLLAAVREISGRRYLQISAPVSHGSSGGPVLSDEGKVVGVISSGLQTGQNLNFAIPVEEVTALLNRHPLSAPLADRGAVALAEVASAAFEANQFLKSAQFYRVAFLLRKNDSVIAYNTAMALVKADRVAEAKLYFELFLQIAPPDDPDIAQVRSWLSGNAPGSTRAEVVEAPTPEPRLFDVSSPPFIFRQGWSYDFVGLIGKNQATLHLYGVRVGDVAWYLDAANYIGRFPATGVFTATDLLTVSAGPYTLEGSLTSLGGGVFVGNYRKADAQVSPGEFACCFTLRRAVSQ